MAEIGLNSLFTDQIDQELLSRCRALKRCPESYHKALIRSLRGHGGRKRGKKRNNINAQFMENPGKAMKLIDGNSVASRSHVPFLTLKNYYKSLYDDLRRPRKFYSRSERVLEGKYGMSAGKLIDRYEVMRALKSANNSSAGLDRVTGQNLREATKIPEKVTQIQTFFNLCLVYGIPKGFATAKVTFIPKEPETTDPSKLRPISVTSHLYRAYAKILNDRLYSIVDEKLSKAQHGYRKHLPGCQAALAKVTSVIAEASVRSRSLALASIDLMKAFDSVSHEHILECLKRLNVDDYLIRATSDVLERASMILNAEGGSYKLKPKRGVPQGLSISGLLFIIALDEVVREADSVNPYTTENEQIKFGAVALVDDLVIMSTSKAKLNEKLRKVHYKLMLAGWDVNEAKSFGFSWRKVSNTRELETGELTLTGQRSIRLMQRNEEFKYLGIKLGPNIKISLNDKNYHINVQKQVKNVVNSQLSISNKIHAIKSIIIPRHQYKLSNYCHRGMWATQGRVNMTRCFEKCDLEIRSALKKITRMPVMGTPVDYLYLPVTKGGFGIKKLANLIPAQRLSNLRKIATDGNMRVFLEKWAYRDVDMMENILRKNGFDPNLEANTQLLNVTIKQIRAKTISASLYIPRGDVKLIPFTRNIKGKGVGLSGIDLQKSIKLRTNSFRTNAYLKRRKLTNNDQCRRCKTAAETVEHLTNSRRCVELNGGTFWSDRHNILTSKLYDWLRTFARGTLSREPSLRAQNQYRPDFMFKTGTKVYVIEVAVCWETARRLGSDRNRIHEVRAAKVSKYSTEDFKSAVRRYYNNNRNDDNANVSGSGDNNSDEQHGVTEINVVPLVFGARGSYIANDKKWMSFCRQAGVRVPRDNVLRFCARDALRFTSKYVSIIINDSGSYGSEEVVQAGSNQR